MREIRDYVLIKLPSLKNERTTPLLFFGWNFSNSIFLAHMGYFGMRKPISRSTSSCRAPSAGERNICWRTRTSRKNAFESGLKCIWRLFWPRIRIPREILSRNACVTFLQQKIRFPAEKTLKANPFAVFWVKFFELDFFRLHGVFWHGKDDELVAIAFRSTVRWRTHNKLENTYFEEKRLRKWIIMRLTPVLTAYSNFSWNFEPECVSNISPAQNSFFQRKKHQRLKPLCCCLSEIYRTRFFQTAGDILARERRWAGRYRVPKLRSLENVPFAGEDTVRRKTLSRVA